MTINQKLSALRELMKTNNVQAYIIPSTDPHMSEYVADFWESRKWISNFTAAGEAYLDWRRTGLPDIQTGPFAKSIVIPVRFVYDGSDKNVNNANYNAALSSLEVTEHTDDVPGYQQNDSPWSKNWLQQGVAKPW